MATMFVNYFILKCEEMETFSQREKVLPYTQLETKTVNLVVSISGTSSSQKFFNLMGYFYGPRNFERFCKLPRFALGKIVYTKL